MGFTRDDELLADVHGYLDPQLPTDAPKPHRGGGYTHVLIAVESGKVLATHTNREELEATVGTWERLGIKTIVRCASQPYARWKRDELWEAFKVRQQACERAHDERAVGDIHR